MKKDTKELNTYEECLLTQYEKYLNILISYSQGIYDCFQVLSRQILLLLSSLTHTGNVKLEKDEHLSEGKEMKQKRVCLQYHLVKCADLHDIFNSY